MTVFIVRGECGEWADWHSWNVGYFNDEEAAKRHVRKAQARADEYNRDFFKVAPVYENTSFAEFMGELDPDSPGSGGYYEVIYSVEEIENLGGKK